MYTYYYTVKPVNTELPWDQLLCSVIDRCLVYPGYIKKDFLHWEFRFKVYTALQLIQGSMLTCLAVL